MRMFLSGAAALAVALASLTSASGAMTTPSSATMPTCAAGDPVVWVNTRSNIYYMSGQSYYGKTKHGMYACKSKAATMGARAARMTKGSMDSSMGSMHDSMGSMHHKKKSSDAMSGGSMGSGSSSSGSMGTSSGTGTTGTGNVSQPSSITVTPPPGNATQKGGQPAGGNPPNNPAATPNPVSSPR